MSGSFAVIAEFAVRKDKLAEFLALARDDARCSVRDEPGCRQFDVLTIEGEGRVVFYEVYDDRAAFDRHLETPHLGRFRECFPDLVERELPVRFLDRAFAPASGDDDA